MFGHGDDGVTTRSSGGESLTVDAEFQKFRRARFRKTARCAVECRYARGQQAKSGGHEGKNQADDHDKREEYTCHQERGVIARTIHARSTLAQWLSGIRVRSDSVSVVMLHRQGRTSDRARINGRMTGRGPAMGPHGDADD